MATCALYDFLIQEQSSTYAPVSFMYQENTHDETVICTGCDSSQSNMIPLNRRRVKYL